MSTSTVEAPERPAPAAPPPADKGRAGGGWRPALRIARRTVRRNLGRSLLVAALVGVPVAGATLVDGLYRTYHAPERGAYRVMADGDALVEVTPASAMPDEYFPSPHIAGWGVESVRDPADVDVLDYLPAGSTVLPAPLLFSTRVERGDGSTNAEVVSTELGHELTQNRVRLVSGAWPSGPDEVLITRPLADRLGLRDGDGVIGGATVTMTDGPTVRVTGIGLDPFQTHSEWNQVIFAAPDSVAVDFLAAEGEPGWDWVTNKNGGIAYIATFPEGTDVDALWPELAAEGIAMLPRVVYFEPDRYEQWSTGTYVGADTLAAAGLVTLIVGLGLLEVILLAGAAFAVSARRQVRDLGLVSANGGTARQVRRIMYAQGFVLGLLGAGLGLAVGVALTIGGKPIWERASGSLIEGWRFGPAELAIAAGVGVLSGLAAAIVPARGAGRMRPIDALSQRFRATPLTARLPRLGLILIAVGAGGGLLASRVAASALAEYAEALEAAAGTGQWVATPPATNAYVALQLLGAVVAVTGLILTISYLITLIARRIRRWPLSARYAARDAARHRHRTTPAVAAIMIVVASAVGLSIGISGADQVDRLRYQPSLPEHVMSVQAGEGAELAPAAVSAIAEQLPSSGIIEHNAPGTYISDSQHSWIDTVYVHAPDPWEAWAEESCTPIDGDGGYDCGDEVMDYSEFDYIEGAELAIATPELMELTYGDAPERAVLDALDAGAIIIPDAALADDGTVTVHFTEWQNDEPGVWTGESTDEITFQAHVAEIDGPTYYSIPRAFISEAAAAEHWDVHHVKTMIQYADTATPDEIDAALDAATNLGYWADVEHGPWRGRDIAPLILAAGAAFVTLVGVGVTVALAAAEGRADLATMAAVGAPPRRRRAIAGWQALVVGGLGTVLGVALGAFFAFLVWPAIGAPSFTVPWETIVLIGVGVPLLAALLAMVFTRSRLPMVRRVE